MTRYSPLQVSSGWLALPLFVAFVVWTVTAGVTSVSVWAVLGLIAMLTPLIGVLLGRAEGVAWLGPPVAILAGFVLGLLGLDGIVPNYGPGLGVLGGVLIGVPFVAVAAILRWGRDAPALLVLVVAGVLDVVTTHAAVGRMASEGSARTAEALTVAVGQVSYDQLGGFSTLLSGNPHADLPLQGFNDPLFSALILLALVGTFLAIFAREGPGGQILPPEPRGLAVPLVLGVGGAAAFEAAGAVSPTYALLGLAAVGLAVTLLILTFARSARRPAPMRPPEPEEPEPSEAAAA